jgi:hypothetical protein
MIRQTRTYYVDVGRTSKALTTDSERFSASTVSFFEGDHVEINLYFKDYKNDEILRLEPNESIVCSVATKSSLNSVENNFIAIHETFDANLDSDGNTYYQGEINLATQEAVDALTRSKTEAVLEVVIVRTDLGHQSTFQAECRILRSVAPATLHELVTPSAHIGSYATARQMMEEIADQRILDLKDGAPLEFDTLYELAHYAQKVRSHEIVIGDFDDYMDGKLLVDQNLTVSQLHALAQNEATYEVTHEPWRPKNLQVTIV